MKIIPFFFSVIFTTLTGYSQKKSSKFSGAGTEQKTQLPVVQKLESEKDSTQYILGAYIGQYLRAINLKIMNKTNTSQVFRSLTVEFSN
jgi:hypothetical protein